MESNLLQIQMGDLMTNEPSREGQIRNNKTSWAVSEYGDQKVGITMITSSFKSVLTAGALALALGTTTAMAAPISCDEMDATANGNYADDCAGVDGGVSSEESLKNLVSGTWGSGFLYVGKDGEAGDLAGFTLSTSTGSGGYMFSYSLAVPAEWEGVTVDWVLNVKQGDDSLISYYFENVVLGIDGLFNSFWLNGADKEVNDFSFIAGFIRPTTIPEPGSVLLLGIGLVGLILGRSKSRRMRTDTID